MHVVAPAIQQSQKDFVQVALLQEGVAEKGWTEVDVMTIDKCQGTEKPAVLLSFVKSNPEHEAGKLLEDWRRINVAITRAQKKLIMVGSRQTLQSNPLFQDLLSLVMDKGWVMSLPLHF